MNTQNNIKRSPEAIKRIAKAYDKMIVTVLSDLEDPKNERIRFRVGKKLYSYPKIAKIIRKGNLFGINFAGRFINGQREWFNKKINQQGFMRPAYNKTI